jgi:hypothetical protein
MQLDRLSNSELLNLFRYRNPGPSSPQSRTRTGDSLMPLAESGDQVLVDARTSIDRP